MTCNAHSQPHVTLCHFWTTPYSPFTLRDWPLTIARIKHHDDAPWRCPVAEYRVQRSFGENPRGSRVELTQADAKVLLDAGYVTEIQSESAKQAPAKKQSAKKP